MLDPVQPLECETGLFNWLEKELNPPSIDGAGGGGREVIIDAERDIHGNHVSGHRKYHRHTDTISEALTRTR